MESIKNTVSNITARASETKDTHASSSSQNALCSKAPARSPPVVASDSYSPGNKASSNFMNASHSATFEQKKAMASFEQALSNMKAVYAGTGLKARQSLLDEIMKPTENAKSSKSVEAKADQPNKGKDVNDTPSDAIKIKEDAPVAHTPLTDEKVKELYAIDRITVLGHNGKLYSTLPALHDSAQAYKDLKASEILDKKIGKLFLKHGVVNELAACLIHNHFDIEDNEQLVTIGNTSIPISMEIDTGSPIGPLNFRFVDDSHNIPGLEEKGVCVGNYESVQLEHDEIPFSIRDKRYAHFLLDYYKVLKQHGLLNVLGFCVRDKPVELKPGEKQKHKMECTAGKANIITELEGEPEAGKSIEAVWAFDVIEPVKKSQYSFQSPPRSPTVKAIVQGQHKLGPIDRAYKGTSRSVVIDDDSDKLICAECTRQFWAMQECHPQPDCEHHNCENCNEPAVHTITAPPEAEFLGDGPEYLNMAIDSGKHEARVWKEEIMNIYKAEQCPYINDNEKFAIINSSSFEETADKLRALSTEVRPSSSPSCAPKATDCTEDPEFQSSKTYKDTLNIAVITDEGPQSTRCSAYQDIERLVDRRCVTRCSCGSHSRGHSRKHSDGNKALYNEDFITASGLRGGVFNDTEVFVDENGATPCSNDNKINGKCHHHYGGRQRPDQAIKETRPLRSGAIREIPMNCATRCLYSSATEAHNDENSHYQKPEEAEVEMQLSGGAAGPTWEEAEPFTSRCSSQQCRCGSNHTHYSHHCPYGKFLKEGTEHFVDHRGGAVTHPEDVKPTVRRSCLTACGIRPDYGHAKQSNHRYACGMSSSDKQETVLDLHGGAITDEEHAEPTVARDYCSACTCSGVSIHHRSRDGCGKKANEPAGDKTLDLRCRAISEDDAATKIQGTCFSNCRYSPHTGYTTCENLQANVVADTMLTLHDGAVPYKGKEAQKMVNRNSRKIGMVDNGNHFTFIDLPHESNSDGSPSKLARTDEEVAMALRSGAARDKEKETAMDTQLQSGVTVSSSDGVGHIRHGDHKAPAMRPKTSTSLRGGATSDKEVMILVDQRCQKRPDGAHRFIANLAKPTEDVDIDLRGGVLSGQEVEDVHKDVTEKPISCTCASGRANTKGGRATVHRGCTLWSPPSPSRVVDMRRRELGGDSVEEVGEKCFDGACISTCSPFAGRTPTHQNVFETSHIIDMSGRAGEELERKVSRKCPQLCRQQSNGRHLTTSNHSYQHEPETVIDLRGGAITDCPETSKNAQFQCRVTLTCAAGIRHVRRGDHRAPAIDGRSKTSAADTVMDIRREED